jgi:MoaA/NifB/PqqE/SkfB family radical SAM enzyme
MYKDKPKLHARQRAHLPGTLRTVALDVTPVCNMKCPHCYAETFVHAKPVDMQVLARALEEFYKLGVFHYVLQGGEPIADPKRLHAILTLCHPDESYINVVSNGWAMTRKRILWLRDLQVDKIAFSLDSGIEAEHDAGRGAGSFKRVMAAIDQVLEAGMLSSISTVVTHESLYSDGFRKAYEFAEAKQIRIDVQIAEPVGKWDGKKDALMTREDSAYIKRLQKECPVLPHGQKMVNRDIFCGEKDHCPAATEFMSLSTDGQLLPCNFLQYSLGNISEHSVKEMRDAIMKSPWFDGRQPECIIGENHDFVDTYVVPYVDQQKPLDAWKVFGVAVPESGCAACPQR